MKAVKNTHIKNIHRLYVHLQFASNIKFVYLLYIQWWANVIEKKKNNNNENRTVEYSTSIEREHWASNIKSFNRTYNITYWNFVVYFANTEK